MGRMFLIEREGPVFKCVACNVQIARNQHLLGQWLHFFEFFRVYNVVIGQVVVPYLSDEIQGYETYCINCGALLGWKDISPLHYFPKFRLDHRRIVLETQD